MMIFSKRNPGPGQGQLTNPFRTICSQTTMKSNTVLGSDTVEKRVSTEPTLLSA